MGLPHAVPKTLTEAVSKSVSSKSCTFDELPLAHFIQEHNKEEKGWLRGQSSHMLKSLSEEEKYLMLILSAFLLGGRHEGATEWVARAFGVDERSVRRNTSSAIEKAFKKYSSKTKKRGRIGRAARGLAAKTIATALSPLRPRPHTREETEGASDSLPLSNKLSNVTATATHQ
jgi:hypothetical protein